MRELLNELKLCDDGGDSGRALELGIESFLQVPMECAVEKRDAFLHLLELVGNEAFVEFPFCVDCAWRMVEDLDRDIEDVEEEFKLYSESIRILETECENEDKTSLAELQEELVCCQEQEETCRNELNRLEGEIERATASVEELIAKERKFEMEEARYWTDFNDYQTKLSVHLEDRDALARRVEIANAHLQMLSTSNVLNDAFHIWYDGPFGTISGFRMGRMPNIRVTWEETNAAWGQCVFLLSHMAKTCKFSFSRYRLFPMGSYPRILDGKTTLELFGPVSQLNLFGGGTTYDKGAIAFLTCLREFSEFARSKDEASHREDPFVLPFPIEGERVQGKSIRYAFHREEGWTAALKLLLADLKFVQSWFIGRGMGMGSEGIHG